MEAPRRRVTVIGAGYVGLVTAAGLASLGHHVELVETAPARLAALRTGRVPIHEAGLQEAFDAGARAGRLRVSERPADDADVVLVCVGTPIGNKGRSDLTQLWSAIDDLRPQLARGVPLVIRSTLPPGSTRRVVHRAGVPPAQVLTNPEFLRQGTALADFLAPTRIVIGHFPEAEPAPIGLVEGLFDRIPAPRLIVDVASAELIKNGANAFLALKLSFANELAILAEEYGADIADVLQGITLDPRIGSRYMQPSFGFGGSCLPKELAALAVAGTDRGLPMHVTTAASTANASSQSRFVQRIEAALGGLSGRTIGLLGLAFKSGTDDVRDSPALGVAARLLDRGAVVQAYDPEAGANALRELPGLELRLTAEDALTGADVAVIATEWPEFAMLDWAELRSVLRTPLVVDGRRLLDGDGLRRLGFRYLAVGTPDHHADPAVAPIGTRAIG
jgi:UDPglucose 6-dehydrogenase